MAGRIAADDKLLAAIDSVLEPCAGTLFGLPINECVGFKAVACLGDKRKLLRKCIPPTGPEHYLVGAFTDKAANVPNVSAIVDTSRLSRLVDALALDLIISADDAS